MTSPHLEPRPTLPSIAELADALSARRRATEHASALWCEVFGRRRCPGYVRPVLAQWVLDHGHELVAGWLVVCAARCRGRRARVRLAYLQRLRDTWVGGGR